MSPSGSQAPEQPVKKPTLTESVDSLISKKRTESAAEGAKEISQSAEGIQREVSEVMVGVEKPKEGISEKDEKKGDRDMAGKGQSAATSDDNAQDEQDWKSVVFPDEEVMVRKIRTAVQLQIKIEWKKAKKFKSKLTSGGAQDYNTAIARIRKLKSLLYSLFTATFDYVKELYIKYFNPSGKRRDVKGVEID